MVDGSILFEVIKRPPRVITSSNFYFLNKVWDEKLQVLVDSVSLEVSEIEEDGIYC